MTRLWTPWALGASLLLCGGCRYQPYVIGGDPGPVLSDLVITPDVLEDPWVLLGETSELFAIVSR